MLSIIIHDILRILASTVATEQVFSADGCTINYRRTKMSEETLEVYMCLRDFFREEERMLEVLEDLELNDEM